MSPDNLGIDLYQLTSYLALRDHLGPQGSMDMSFFFRRLPRNRRFVVACGLHHVADHAENLRLSPLEVDFLGCWIPQMDQRMRDALLALDGFEGEIDALPEGTLAFAGPARLRDGSPARLDDGSVLRAATPLLQVRTDLLRAKLVETPWLSRLNHMSMVASKAARVVLAARRDGVERPVLEFGQRRTHQDAAVDASYAAYVGGCSATSNLAASYRFGIPAAGTMDHFAVMACERPGVPRSQTEEEFFRHFAEVYPNNAVMLVDTYDTFRGIRNAVRAAGERLHGVRIDSNVTPEVVRRAKALLAELGASHVKVVVSDGLDEYRVRELAEAGADAFGVGENITCSPDAACGIGAVGKLSRNGSGTPVMKCSKGSSKATLPGPLQCYRMADHDYLAFRDEEAPAGGRPLLQPLWRGRRRLCAQLPGSARTYVREQVDALPGPLRVLSDLPDEEVHWPIVLSDRLYRETRERAAFAAVAD